MSEGLFRKASIDKVSSPEQLDLLMRVTSPVGWLALASIGVMIVAVGVWSVLGTVPDLVDAQGTLFRGERRYDIKATMAGSLLSLDVRVGSIVQAGQTIGRIRREEARLEQRAAADERARAAEDQLAANEATIRGNQAMAARLRSQLSALEQQWRLQKQLVDQGIKAPRDLLALERDMDGLRGQRDSLLAEARQLEARSVTLKADVASAQAGMDGTAEIRSTEAGRVVEAIKSTGDKVNEGEALVRIERIGTGTVDYCGGDVHALVYVPAGSSVKVAKGQFVRVSPAGIAKEEYGFILGRVAWVASDPASTADMQEKLKNDQLVKQFMEAGPVVETRVCLERPTGGKATAFRWSSSEGPPQSIETGPCSVSMVVDERRPYTYVIPTVRRTLGL